MGITNWTYIQGVGGWGEDFFGWSASTTGPRSCTLGNGCNTPSLGLSVLLFPDYTFIYLTGLFVNNKIDNLYSSGSQGIAPSRVVAVHLSASSRRTLLKSCDFNKVRLKEAQPSTKVAGSFGEHQLAFPHLVYPIPGSLCSFLVLSRFDHFLL